MKRLKIAGRIIKIQEARPGEKPILDGVPPDGGSVAIFDDGYNTDEMFGRVIREILRNGYVVVVGVKED
jgi:hypothetical protein